jgi:hypothetical protein
MSLVAAKSAGVAAIQATLDCFAALAMTKEATK